MMRSSAEPNSSPHDELGGASLRDLLEYANERDLQEMEKQMKQGQLDPRRFRDLSEDMMLRKDMLTEFVPLMCHALNVTREEWERYYDMEDDNYLIELFANLLDAMEAIAKAEGLSVARVESLLKDGAFQLDRQNLLRKETPSGWMEQEKHLALDKGYVRIFVDAMQRHLDDSCTATKALDLASGAGVFPFEYTLRSVQDDDDSRILEWYPSEWRYAEGRRNPLGVLRLALKMRTMEEAAEEELSKFKIQNTQGLRIAKAKGRQEKILNNPGTGRDFIDSTGVLGVGAHGLPLYPNHIVKVVGLSSDLNNTLGTIIDRDPACQGRLEVLLDGQKQPTSLLPTNLVNLEEKAISDILIFRSLEIDLEDDGTWSGHPRDKLLHGKCAVVTCTSLMTQVGKRNPRMWRGAMEVASKMLAPGGILLQHDIVTYGGFGDEERMRNHVRNEGLGLELVECSEPIQDPNATEDWEKMLLLVWKKIG